MIFFYGMKNHQLPTLIQRTNSTSSSGDSRLWARLGAFLSLRAPKTRETYLGIINEWCRFLGAEPGSELAASRIVAATDMHAITYRNWLEKRPGEKPRHARSPLSQSKAIDIRRAGVGNAKKTGLENTLSNATIAKKFAALRRIYKMFVASDLGVKINPFDTDRVPSPPKESGRKRPTEMIDFKLIKKILNVADDAQPKGLRDKAILAVLFGGGLRRSEAAALRICDVKRSSKGTTYLHLRATKAKKDADQAIPKWAAEVIAKLLDLRLNEKASEADYLFISYTGKGGSVPTRAPITGSGIYKLFKSYCKKAGAGDFVTPHSARATAITKLLSDGISHRNVQEFSRHSSIQMVELYDKRRIGVDENPAKDLDYE